MARYKDGGRGLGDIYAIDEQQDADALRRCKEQFSTEQIALCQNYADKAAQQATWNFQNKCGNAKDGVGSGRWTWNSDHHFAFCTAGLKRARDSGGDEAAIKAAMKAEEDAREEANKMCVPNMIRKRPSPEMTKRDPKLKPNPSADSGAFGGKSRQVERAKAATQPAAGTIPSNAMDRLGGGAGPSGGGSYKSKDGAATQTRSSGAGGGSPPASSAGELPKLRSMPANTGSMSTGGGEKFRAPN
jgi:hypothetical protein